MAQATFKTSYLQHITVLDADVVGTAGTTFRPMQLVTVTPRTGANGFFNIASASDLASATHLIAQGDIAMKALNNNANSAYGHIPVENGTYRIIEDTVATTATSAGTGASTTWKKVAVYKLVNKDDVYAL